MNINIAVNLPQAFEQRLCTESGDLSSAAREALVKSTRISGRVVLNLGR
jgi:hypothetical protein